MNNYLCHDTETGELFGVQAKNLKEAKRIISEQYDGDATKVKYVVVSERALEMFGVDVY